MAKNVKKAAEDRLKRIRENIDRADRVTLLEWMKWNDPNSIYSDADQVAEGRSPLTDDEVRQAAGKMFFDPDNMSPDEAERYQTQIEIYFPARASKADPLERMYDLGKNPRQDPDPTVSLSANRSGRIPASPERAFLTV